MKFTSIYNKLPQPQLLDQTSDVVRDESLTISQIISLHLRGLPCNVKLYDEVQYEIGDNEYNNEKLNTDYYELESDFTDFNPFVQSSGDNFIVKSHSEDQSNVRANSPNRTRSNTLESISEQEPPLGTGSTSSVETAGNVIND